MYSARAPSTLTPVSVGFAQLPAVTKLFGVLLSTEVTAPAPLRAVVGELAVGAHAKLSLLVGHRPGEVIVVSSDGSSVFVEA